MINYMYASLEAVIYDPFFIIYTASMEVDTLTAREWTVYQTILAGISLTEIFFIILSGYLVAYGCNKRGFRINLKKSRHE